MHALKDLPRSGPIGLFRDIAIVFVVVLVAALFGILTRPVGFLAAIWPANAILLGLLVLVPRLATPWGWISAFASYLVADLLTGNTLLPTLWLTGANMAGAYLGFSLFMRLPPEDRTLSRPISVIWLFAICMMSAALAGAVGAGAARVVFDRDIVIGFIFWFTTELVNMLIFLPVILTWPGIPALRTTFRRKQDKLAWLPAFMFGVMLLSSPIIGGGGAFAYPIAALIWCALTYSLFTTALLSLTFATIQLVSAALGFFPAPVGADELINSVSLRLAICLLVLGPIAVASVNSARAELVERLHHVANHDALTGALSRGAFLERAQRALESSFRNSRMAVLMLDIDHFKGVNDQYGHPTGDRLLAEATRTMQSALRDDDLLGRLGGEEFAIVLSHTKPEDALAVAERIRSAVENRSVRGDDGSAITMSISIGLAYQTGLPNETISTMLAAADKALYLAKTRGRNRVEEAKRQSELVKEVADGLNLRKAIG